MHALARHLDRSRYGLLGLALLVALLALVPTRPAQASGPISTQVKVDDDGFEATIKRPFYRLDLELEGRATFAADDSDLATLAHGGQFELEELLSGTRHRYLVVAERDGVLRRTYSRDGVAMPLDEPARAWRRAALQRAFRLTGLDAEGRAARFLARGPTALLDEIAQIDSDAVRATYLGVAFTAPAVTGAALGRAVELARDIGSDFELRRALDAALARTDLPPDRVVAVLDAARGIGSDFELASLMVAAAPRLPTDAATIAAWRAAIGGIQSDFELRRALEATFARAAAPYRGPALAAAASIGSDFELRSALEASLPVIDRDPALLTTYLASAKDIGSDFEMRQALTGIAPRLGRDDALLGAYLDRVESMSSDFEQREALTAIATQVPRGQVRSRYLAIARGLGDHDRGEVLSALIESDGI